MIPDQLYFTWLGWTAYLVIYLPLTLVVCALIYSKLAPTWKSSRARTAMLVSVALVVATVPLWDVFVLSFEAQRLCREQAGLKVYRTVEAEGFLGDSGIEIWSKYGYRYVESGGTLGRKFRDTMKHGKAVSDRVDEYISRYQLRAGDMHRVVGRYFSRTSQQVIDRGTGEVLGELVVFGIYPGWLDNIAIAATGMGSGFAPWHCGDEPSPGSGVLRLGGSDVVRATIKPIKSTREDREEAK
jgi:hypothetical protein